MEEFQIGQKVPDIALPDATGAIYRLSEDLSIRQGRRFIVYFRGSSSPESQEMLDDLAANCNEFQKNNVHLTAISSDSLGTLTKLHEEHHFPFPVAADEQFAMLHDYGVHQHNDKNASYEEEDPHGEPAVFLLDEEGCLLYQQRQTSSGEQPDAELLLKIISDTENK